VGSRSILDLLASLRLGGFAFKPDIKSLESEGTSKRKAAKPQRRY
jgi:hypothetical protein